MTLCSYPELLNDARFPSDVKKRASDLLNGCAGRSVGLYIKFLKIFSKVKTDFVLYECLFHFCYGDASSVQVFPCVL